MELVDAHLLDMGKLLDHVNRYVGHRIVIGVRGNPCPGVLLIDGQRFHTGGTSSAMAPIPRVRNGSPAAASMSRIFGRFFALASLIIGPVNQIQPGSLRVSITRKCVVELL